jgi:hypothetical protein
MRSNVLPLQRGWKWNGEQADLTISGLLDIFSAEMKHLGYSRVQENERDTIACTSVVAERYE